VRTINSSPSDFAYRKHTSLGPVRDRHGRARRRRSNGPAVHPAGRSGVLEMFLVADDLDGPRFDHDAFARTKSCSTT
jgi:hypothetical protein